MPRLEGIARNVGHVTTESSHMLRGTLKNIIVCCGSPDEQMLCAGLDGLQVFAFNNIVHSLNQAIRPDHCGSTITHVSECETLWNRRIAQVVSHLNTQASCRRVSTIYPTWSQVPYDPPPVNRVRNPAHAIVIHKSPFGVGHSLTTESDLLACRTSHQCRVDHCRDQREKTKSANVSGQRPQPKLEARYAGLFLPRICGTPLLAEFVLLRAIGLLAVHLLVEGLKRMGSRLEVAGRLEGWLWVVGGVAWSGVSLGTSYYSSLCVFVQ